MVEKILSVEPFRFTKDTSKPMNNGSATVPQLNLPPAGNDDEWYASVGRPGKAATRVNRISELIHLVFPGAKQI
jgi:hypothetical protein